jgi:hypothetical protein
VIYFDGLLIIHGTQNASLNGKPFDENIKSRLRISVPKVQSEKEIEENGM